MAESARTFARPRPAGSAARRRRLFACIVLGFVVGLPGLLTHVVPAGASDAGGIVITRGAAGFYGSAETQPVTGIASSPSGHGYWLAAADGGVFGFGDAGFHGSMGASPLDSPVVDIAATRSGGGYWLVAADGAIFSFGDASFHGSTADQHLNQRIVGMAATSTGGGYWLVAADGGIFSFGDAAFHGSAGSLRLREPIAGMAATETGGYWMVAEDGGIFSFGDAAFHGSAGSVRSREPVVGMAATPGGGGYWLVAADGGIFSFGDATFHGSASEAGVGPVVGMASTPAADGYWVATGGEHVGAFEVTCYSLSGTTKSGTPVSEEAVAVDPRVIPLGTRIFIEDVGTRVAVDTGADIKGRRLDVWHPSSAYCQEFGRKTLTVHLTT